MTLVVRIFDRPSVPVSISLEVTDKSVSVCLLYTNPDYFSCLFRSFHSVSPPPPLSLSVSLYLSLCLSLPLSLSLSVSLYLSVPLYLSPYISRSLPLFCPLLCLSAFLFYSFSVSLSLFRYPLPFLSLSQKSPAFSVVDYIILKIQNPKGR